jgi:beta-glucosidase-like glycosyl hydrolase
MMMIPTIGKMRGLIACFACAIVHATRSRLAQDVRSHPDEDAGAAGLSRPWLNAAQPIAQRVSSLMAAMTLEEKISQLSYECPTLQWNTTGFASTGIGSVGIECSTPAGDATTCDMTCRIAMLRQFQLDAIRTTRLGIPTTFVVETSHCGAAGGVVFPMGVTQGSTWDTELVGEVQAVIALEARSWGASRGLSPEISIVTDPRFGRTEENFASDPLLGTKMAKAAVIGLQGGVVSPADYLPSPNSSVAAEAKHCCAYAYSGLDGGSADMSDKTLHDVYLRPWRAFIAAGGSGMMASHNTLNAVPMHANGAIFTDLFRGRWNYSGFVHSDYGNIGALVNTRTAANGTMAAGLALRAGLDQAFMDGAFSTSILTAGVATGEINENDIERAASKILQAKFAAGLFDGQLPDPSARPNIGSVTHRALARRTATEGAVLLTNPNHVLPLDVSKLRSIAIVGPFSGCAATAIAAGVAGTRAGEGSCAYTPAMDCDGDDLVKIFNVTSAPECCALCNANATCTVAVLATDQLQCLLKSGCNVPMPNANRVMIDVGRLPPPPPPNPLSCRAMRGMLGGYSNFERDTDQFLDNSGHVVTLLEAALNAANKSGALNVSWAQGVDQQALDTSGIPAAVALAAASDVTLVVLGDGGESVGYDSSVSCGEGADRPSLDLPGVQLALLEALVDTGKPVIVILAHGRPVTFGTDYGGSLVSQFTAGGKLPLDQRAAAVLATWRSGCEGGNAMWDLLFGTASPSGRLPNQWPISVGGVRIGGVGDQLQMLSTQGGSGFTLGTPFAPNFAFGHGLDYLAVTFGASSVTVDTPNQLVNVTVALNNAAPRSGLFVVEVFFRQMLSRFVRYDTILGGFVKVLVPASGGTTAALAIPFADLAYYDPLARDYVLEAGAYKALVCSSSRKEDCPAANTHGFQVPSTVTGL